MGQKRILIFDKKTDYRVLKFNDGTEEYDDSHSLCPFEKYDSTVIVLNKVNQLNKIDSERQNKLELVKSELTRIKMFLYE